MDRILVEPGSPETESRTADSAETAFFEGQGECILLANDADGKPVEQRFSDRFELDGIIFEEPTPKLFSFNDPVGACPRCEGYGNMIGIDRTW
jgi:excinuclease ABC subunit A